MRQVDLSGLIKQKTRIDWKKSIGCVIPFEYDDTRGNIKIVDVVDNKRVTVEYNNCQMVIGTSELRECKLRNIINPKSIYKDGDIINNKKIQYSFYKKLNNGKMLYYNVTCLTCGYNYNTSYVDLNKVKCAVCSEKKIVKGINDLWTTCPEMAKMLKKPDIGYKISYKHSHKVNFICLNCNKEISDYPFLVYNRGLNCPNCSNNKSLPNKIMSLVLYSLGCEYLSDQYYDWCRFPTYQNSNSISYGLYDFVIPSKKIIIEMDGGLGHGIYVMANSKYSVEETIYRDYQKDLLAHKNGYKVIRIDCNYKGNDGFEYCKNNILNSELSFIFDLNKIDWDFVFKSSLTGEILSACNLYNDGKTIVEISSKLNLNRSTVSKYLSKGNQAGICNYSPHSERQKAFQIKGVINKNASPIACNELGEFYQSLKVAENVMQQKHGISFSSPNWCRAMRQNKAYKNFTWRKITREEFNYNYINNRENTYGDMFY